MAVIKLTTYVKNIANVLTLFDKIRYYRSTSGEVGPYVAITADSAEAATVSSSNAAPFNINGTTLTLKVDGGAEQTVTFISPDPVNVDNAIGEINGQTGGLVATESSGAVVLTSNTTGTSSLIEITGGTSLTEFGFTVAEYNGKDADVVLVAGTSDYEYDDQNGDVTNYYYSAYVDSTTGTLSSSSDPVQGNVSSVIPTTDLITAKLDLADLSGQPLADMVISVYNVYTPPLVVSTIGVIGASIEMVTDSIGHAEAELVRGSVVDIAIAGTPICRRITVPSTGTEFNLMDEVATADDLFQIQTPDIPAAVRRS